MYQLQKDRLNNKIVSVSRKQDGASIPIVFDNTDYQAFKKAINADEAQLEDSEGTLMTAEQAKEFLATLP